MPTKKINTFAVRKDEWDTKESTDKSGQPDSLFGLNFT